MKTVISHQLSVISEWKGRMVKNCGRSQVYRKAYEFAIQVVLTTRAVRERTKEYLLFRQLLRSGTSIGANIAEANGAVSSADFSNKISIAYKETLETKYWLDVLMDCGILEKKFYTPMLSESRRNW